MVDFAGPYFVAHQDLLVRRNDTEITGPETLNGKRLCSVPGTTSAANVKSRYKGRIELAESPDLLRLRHGARRRKGRCRHHRRRHPRGLRGGGSVPGRLKVIGKGFSDEIYGVGIKKGDTAMVEKVNAALKQYIADGSWKPGLDGPALRLYDS